MNNFYTHSSSKEIWLHFTHYTSALTNNFFLPLYTVSDTSLVTSKQKDREARVTYEGKAFLWKLPDGLCPSGLG